MRKSILFGITLLLLFGIFPFSGFSQSRTITGIVMDDATKEPLRGASITVKGTSRATSTDETGNFSILVSTNEVLVVSNVGYVTTEAPVGSATVLTITLEASERSEDEVIVTAYGIARSAKSLGYSTPRVSGADVSNTQRENFMNGLAGRVPGLYVNATSGDPGASSQMFLRGIVSITGDNSPLLVIDGLPVDNSVVNQNSIIATRGGAVGTNRDMDYSNRAVDINPADIESYTILKGPEATALYGNLGASGAIVITTRRAKQGTGAVTYNNSFRFEKQRNFPEVQQVYSQGVSNGVYDGTRRTYFGPRYPDSLEIYDNIHNFFQVGFTQKHNVILEGGGQGLTYRWSNEYTDNRGTIPTTQLKRITSRLTATARISPKLNATSSFAYSNTYNRKVTKGQGGYLMSLLQFPSRFDVRKYQDELGNRILTTGDIYTEPDNPLWDVNRNRAEDRTNRFMGNSSLTFKPWEWLSLTGALSADIYTVNGLSANHPQSYRASGSSGSPTGGRISEYIGVQKFINGSLVASAKHKFGNFDNTYILGSNFNDYNYRTNSEFGEQLFDPNFYSINNTLKDTRLLRLTMNRYRNFGVFAQSVLGYKTLLYLTLTGRVDGASRLRPNPAYFFYPAGSLAFNFSDLQAVKDWGVISYGKLRASYGYTGKEPRLFYVTTPKLSPASSTGGGFAYDIVSGGDRRLRPEYTRNIEVGTDLRFLNDRIGVDFSIFNLRSIDQIVSVRSSYGTGMVIQTINGGIIENKGYEIQLMGTPVKQKDFSWDMTLNITHSKGVVKTIAEEIPEFYDSDTWLQNGVRSNVYPGASTGSMGGWVMARNNKGDILINPTNGLPLLRNSSDYVNIGDRTPKALFGFSNNIRYKNFDLSFLFDMRYGGDVYNATQYTLYTTGLSTKTLDREVPRVFKGVLNDGLQNTANPTPNTITVTPYYNSSFYTSTTNGVAPEMFVEKDINAFRLRDITLGYSFPESFTNRTGVIKNLGVFITVTDVFLLTNYSGIDPDSNGNTPVAQGLGGYGIDIGNMGRPLGINFGLRMRL